MTIALRRPSPAACGLVLSLAAAFGGLPAPSPAVGQPAAAERERKDPAALMGERAYRRYESLAGLYSDGKYDEALAAVEAFLRGELNDYERAMGEQLGGYVLVALGRPGEAVARFERALRLDALPNSVHFGLMRSLAQLYAGQGEWQATIDLLSEYLRYQARPAPEDGIIMAQSHAQMQRYRAALPWVRQAIEAAGDRAEESWYQLELAIHFELRNWDAALGVLRVLVARWPDRLRYWEMMAGAYQELERPRDAVAALMTAYDAGLVTGEPGLLRLARLSLYAELPFRAGRILEDAIAAGRVEANAANLQLLLQAWSAAREYARAGAVIDRLAPMTGDGDLLLHKARLLLELGDWQGAVEAAHAGLELGQVSQPGSAWLLVGIALLELDRLRESRQALQRAQEFDTETRRQAREWQRFVDERIEVAGLRSRR